MIIIIIRIILLIITIIITRVVLYPYGHRVKWNLMSSMTWTWADLIEQFESSKLDTQFDHEN